MVLTIDPVSFDYGKYSSILPFEQEWRGDNSYGLVRRENGWQVIHSKSNKYKLAIPVDVSRVNADFLDDIYYVNAQKEIHQFYSEIYSLEVSDQIWKLSEIFNEMVANADFKEIDNYLECVNVKSIDPQAALSILVLTNRIKRKLYLREDLYRRVSELAAFTDPKTLKWIKNLA